MKYKLLVSLFLGSYIILSAQTDCDQIDLIKHFEASVSSTDSMVKINYFNCFPSTFKGFMDLYGEVGRPLYDDHYDHIVEFSKTFKYFHPKEWTSKLINLSQKGRWDADAVFMLQAVLMSQFREDGKIFLLKNLESIAKKKFIISFTSI